MDVVVNLFNRDRVEEAINLQLDAVLLASLNDLSVESVMRMPIKDMVALSSSLQVPGVPPVEGWDNVYYGKAAFDEHSG